MANANPYNAQDIKSEQLATIMRRINRVEQADIVAGNVYGTRETIIGAGTYTALLGAGFGNGNVWIVGDGTNIREYTVSGNLVQTIAIDSGKSPMGIATDDDEVFVSVHDGATSMEIHAYDYATGTLQRSFGSRSIGWPGLTVVNPLTRFGTSLVFVDFDNKSVEIFTTGGTLTKTIIVTSFNNPYGVTTYTDSDGDTHILINDAKTGANRLLVFNEAGTTLESTTNFTTGSASGMAMVGDNVVGLLGDGANDLTAVKFSALGGTDPTSVMIDNSIGFFTTGFGIHSSAEHIYSAESNALYRYESKVALGVTPWKQYGSAGTSRQVSSEKGYIGIGPENGAFHKPLPISNLQGNERTDPLNIRLLRDVRDALVRRVSSGRITSIVSGNALGWAFSGDEDLYQNAIAGKETAIGRTAGSKYQWARSVAQVAASGRIYDVDIAELDLCSRFLARCVGVSDT